MIYRLRNNHETFYASYLNDLNTHYSCVYGDIVKFYIINNPTDTIETDLEHFIYTEEFV